MLLLALVLCATPDGGVTLSGGLIAPGDAGSAPLLERHAFAGLEAQGTSGWSLANQGPLGTLPKEVIREHLRPVVREARRCYELALTRDAPGSEGRLDVAFTIGREGSVLEVMVRRADPRLSPTLRECVLAAVRKLKTPAPDGGIVRVTFPFRFAPR